MRWFFRWRKPTMPKFEPLKRDERGMELIRTYAQRSGYTVRKLDGDERP